MIYIEKVIILSSQENVGWSQMPTIQPRRIIKSKLAVCNTTLCFWISKQQAKWPLQPIMNLYIWHI